MAIAFAAQAQPKPRQAYVAVNQLGQTAAPDDSTLNARVGKDVWQIKMAVPCHNLSFNASGYLLNLYRRHNQHLRAAGPRHFRARDQGCNLLSAVGAQTISRRGRGLAKEGYSLGSA